MRKTREECEHVKETFFEMSSLEVSEEVRQYLKRPTFDNWQWEDAEIMVLLQVMYTDLDFITTFNIELDVLLIFLYEVSIPFHNFPNPNLTTEQYKRIREGIIKCILSTDMSRHTEIYKINKFKAILPVFDFSNKHHRDVLMMVMIKVSDISNEARPMDVTEPWLDCLLQEFFKQSDMEKLEGLPVTPFMDRDKVTKPSSQTGFIRFVLFPVFVELANLFPFLVQHIIDPVRKALDYDSEMEKALEREKQNRIHNEKATKPKESTNNSDLPPEPEMTVKSNSV